MKTKAIKGILSGLLITFTLIMNSQTISIDSAFNSDGEIYPFDTTQAIYGLSIESGSVILYSDTSLVRVILVDTFYNEYLVYEAYPLIVTETSFSISDVCDETCYLDGVYPYSLEIQIVDAEINITALYANEEYMDNADSLQNSYKQQIELSKVSIINNLIDETGMLWYADTNNISQMSYFQKKNLFGEKYRLYGLDYYCGGVFEKDAFNSFSENVSDLIKDWDWRNRHGANDPLKSAYYYDGDPNGSGWLTSIKNQNTQIQECTGTCYIFAPVSVTEVIANLYFNNPTLNYNLSEQHILECDSKPPPGDCKSGPTSAALYYMTNSGVFDDESYPNGPHAGECRDESIIPQNWIFTEGGYDDFDMSDDPEVYKQAVIEYGPVCISLINYFVSGGSGNHFMTLVGYGTVKEGDILYEHPVNGNIVKIAGADDEGKLYWIFKNSWGTGWGDLGYMYHMDEDIKMGGGDYLELPIKDALNQGQQRRCLDKDKDGYCNWGISENPPGNCSEYCQTQPDSDDSECRIGPFNQHYYGIPVAPTLKVKVDNFEIHNNEFYRFYDENMGLNDELILTIHIINEGNAQLNTIGFNNVVKSGINADDFEILEFPSSKIPKQTDTSFRIRFTLREPIDESKIANFTIKINEIDIEEFQFALVFTDCEYDPQPEFIDSYTEWHDWDIIFSDVIVERACTLMILGNRAFTPEAGLFIEQGASVYIDGGLLTNFCDDLWQGVDVWGNERLTQNNQANQGFIKLENGGKIEFADIGIETIKYYNEIPDYDKTGGIIIIEDGSIENCRIGIRFYPYTNIHPGTQEVLPNLSYFTDADFITNKFLYQYSSPEKNVWLDEVNGIDFKGCIFKNSYMPEGGISINRGIGLHSFLSSFSVINHDPFPEPGNFIQSKFENLEYGIKVYSERTAEIINIDSAYFNDNLRGIYLALVEYANIIRNEFHVRSNNSVWSDNEETVGIYTDYFTTNFTIEENNFYSDLEFEDLEFKKCAGIVINNTGGDANEIYRNNFNNLYTGIIAQGTNRDEIQQTGLCLRCNNFSNNWTDIYVYSESTGSNEGIAEYQGSLNEPAGNLFSDHTIVIYNIMNDVFLDEIEYFYHWNVATYPNIYPEEVTENVSRTEGIPEYSQATSCPSNIPGGGAEFLRSSMNTSRQIADSLNDVLVEIVDSGDTPDLEFEVNTSVPEEAIEIRAELLSSSPYLSDTVMKTSVNKEDVLNNAIIRDVLVANPQSAKSSELMGMLATRQQPMPQYMKNQILQGRLILSDKDKLEAKIGAYKLVGSQAYKKLVNKFLLDTSLISIYDSLRSIAGNNIYSYYNLAITALGEFDTIRADAILDSIPILFNLSLNEQNELNSFEEIYDLKRNIRSRFSTIYELDSVQLNMLESLSAEINIPGEMAFNILLALNLESYDEPLYFPPSYKTTNAGIVKLPNTEKTTYLKIFPNPASNYITIEYDLSEIGYYQNLASIRITDQQGRSLDKIECKNETDQFIYLTTKYNNGVYYCSLYNAVELIETVKFIILKN